MTLSRRCFLCSLPAAALAADSQKGRTFSSPARAYKDPSTDSVVFRLTDPAYTSTLPAHYGRPVSRRGNFLVVSSDAGGAMNVYRLDYKSGETRQLTDATALEPLSVTLTADDRGFCYLDNGRLFSAAFAGLRAREVYRIGDGFEAVPGINITEDGLYATLVERKSTHYRLRLIRMADGVATTLTEADEELRDPVPRPRRASVLYRRAGGAWLANFDGKQNYRLRLADGEAAAAVWTPDGRAVLYLNVPPEKPAEKRRLNNIREFTPDSNEDKAIANTTQFAVFERNSDGSMFVGASGSKASPHLLLLSRAVKREFTLCEHRASDARLVAPVFSPNSQRVFFTSDQHGKPAIYSMLVDKLVEDTAEEGKQ
jgi:oligogalacturonide lyase